MTTGSGGVARRPGGGAAGRSRGRGRPSRLGRIGPAAGAGRWSLVAPLLEPRPTDTVSAHATAMQLVERHGVVTREAVLAEGVVGGFASVYGVLKVLEDRGQVRRGYFVSGLGAAQFALPGAVDRLRSMRRPDDPMYETPAGRLRRSRWVRRRSCSRPPTRRSPTVARCRGRSRPGDRRASVPRWSCCITACPSCGTTAVLTISSRSPRPARITPGPRRSPVSSTRAGRAAWRFARSTAPAVGESPDGGWVSDIAHAAGFVDGYRGLVLRRL